MEPNRFYDIHFHEMDLSHANLTAFLNRFFNEKNGLLNPGFVKKLLVKNLSRWKVLLLPFISYSILSEKIISVIRDRIFSTKIRNLLSYMETSIVYDFLIVEYFLKNRNPKIVTAENKIKIGEMTYDRIVLCPLLIDFGYKNLKNKGVFYNIPPQKPVTRQVKDMFDAIWIYYNNEISIRVENGITKFKLTSIVPDYEKKLFEIYPFMGINPKNYSYEEETKMLDKYFSDFSKGDTIDERRRKLNEKMGLPLKDLEDENDCKNRFAGIKVYPPLGFEPWPADIEERKKVGYLYDFCIEKNIPIVTHCGTSGFLADVDNTRYADPGFQWKNVIENKPGIKINFAHFGDGSEEWKKTILEYINRNESKIYTDFSCNTEHDEYFKKLKETIETCGHDDLLTERILFGSDFMINLIWSKSYNEYLGEYIKTRHLNDALKDKFARQNSERFLFG
ncbi:MAG TPA: amidohydrolase family protein [Bacteroidales bacterium]|nr:amidohydrolase family protein [Bacteroidales bacterium]